MKIIERTHNLETGEIVDIERDETAAEQSIREARQIQQATAQAKAEARATARAALLAQLGITEEQAKLLLG